mgnify:CR=1 FL=1
MNSQDQNENEVFFNLSSGTWAMAWIWFFLSETHTPAILLQSSIEGGVKEVKVPFEISGRSLFKNLRVPKNQEKKSFSILDENKLSFKALVGNFSVTVSKEQHLFRPV